MAFGNFESPTPDKDNEAEKQPESSNEESVGKNPDQYKDADGIGQKTGNLGENLNDETIEKIKKLKEKQQAAEEDSDDQVKAA